MEDAHACVLDLQPLEGEEELKPAASDIRISFFGVYDGHGGDKVALYTGEHLHEIVAKQEAFKKGQFEQALKDGFLAIDRSILSGMWVSGRSMDLPLTSRLRSSLRGRSLWLYRYCRHLHTRQDLCRTFVRVFEMVQSDFLGQRWRLENSVGRQGPREAIVF